MMTRRDVFRLTLAAGTPWIGGAQDRTNLLSYGRNDPLPETIALRAGPVTAIFDIETSALRYVRVGRHEVVRAAYAAVRDSDWGTVQPRLHGLKISAGEDGFELTFDVDCVRPPYDFAWRGRIAGGKEGTIRFTFDGEARTTFLRNRLGFALLHPVRGFVGHAVEIERADGTRQNGIAPESVSPHQPYFDIKAITHAVEGGLSAEVRFEGETFEMEDHRNWTDASFKTYCTPLALPYPVEVKKGTKVAQAIEIRAKGALPAAMPRSRMTVVPVALSVDPAASRPAPKVGIGSAYHGQTLPARESARLRALKPAHLRVDCKLTGSAWQDALRRAAAEASSLGADLEVAAHLPEDAAPAIRELRERLTGARARVAGVLLYRAQGKAADDAWLAPLRKELGGAKAAVGTDDGFVALNRGRPAGSVFDAVCYSITPQVHAIDNMTVVENLAAQADTVATSLSISGGKPVWVSPVTLKMRYNPNAKNPDAPTPAGQLPASVDTRQLSLFGAAWTAASLKFLGQAGAARATYYETTGWRGTMETERGSALPALFPSTAGAVFPLYHVLADFADFSSGQIVQADSAEPLRAEILALRSGLKWRLVLCNLTHEYCPVRLEGVAAGALALSRRLNAGNAAAACERPEEFRRSGQRGRPELTLAPYELLTIDLG